MPALLHQVTEQLPDQHAHLYSHGRLIHPHDYPHKRTHKRTADLRADWKTNEFTDCSTDIYTNVATQLGDAYFFFPMMFSHFDTVYSQGRGNDGLLEARMVVSRNGQNLSYIDRGAWLSRGSGEHRANATGVYEGAFDAASTAVLVGLVQTETETIMYGWGSQYTHGGYVGFTQPPCRGKGDGPPTITDATRLTEALPTLRLLIDAGAKVVCCSHLGRPKKAKDEAEKARMKLTPIAQRALHVPPPSTRAAQS